MIDLSNVEPEDLEVACLEQVPNCPFITKKPRRRASKKKAEERSGVLA